MIFATLFVHGPSSTVVLVDEEDIISTVLAGVPDSAQGQEWDGVSDGAAKVIAEGVSKMTFAAKNLNGRRGKFATCSAGYSYGGGRETVGNVLINGKKNREIFEGVLKSEDVQRIVGFTNSKLNSPLLILPLKLARYV